MYIYFVLLYNGPTAIVLNKVLYCIVTLEISLYLAIRPRLTKFSMYPYLVGLYQECPNYGPGVKFCSVLGVTSFTWAYIGKTLEISLYLAMKPRATKICV